MNTSEKIDAYLEKHKAWDKQLVALRKILQSSELEETVKWGAPTYTLNGKIVASIAGFKQHCALWFHQGVFLKDTAGKLVNAQQGTTRGLRQWRFEQGDKVDAALVKSYVSECIANHKSGKQIKAKPKRLKLPDELAELLDSDTAFKKQFEALTPGRQREYADHVESAKQAKTRLSRLEKIKPMIEAGVGLNDKYRDC